METFGDALRRYRLAARLTQEELAERARVSRREISDLERGQRTRPWRETVQALAGALCLGPAERARLEAAARASPPAVSPPSLAGHAPDSVASARTNLPMQVTSFVGRERERAEVARLLARARLLTLTGAGGCGKTRLAVHVAADLVDAFPDGVWFVDLGPLADPAVVPLAVASAVGIRELPGRPPPAVLADHLHPRDLLLVLDNCEHLVDACARVADALLRACPRLRLLATSRELLGIAGETAWRVPSLSLPDPRQPLSPETLARCEAARLFLDRAQAARPGFALTDRNAPAVAQICRRLDGIPLAIELAAARVRVLTVEQIAARLDDRFRLLSGGSRTALRRQQTLQATVEWSYDLLSEAERALFRRLAVFAGGFTLEAAEAVCAGDGLAAFEILDRLGALVDKSLVVAEGREAQERYKLLETIRQYAAEKLAASGEAATIRRRHAAHYYPALVEGARLDAWVPMPALWRDWPGEEPDNLRAALRWFRESRDATTGPRPRRATDVVREPRASPAEGRERLGDRRGPPGAATPDAERANALDAAVSLAYFLNDYPTAIALARESLAIRRERGDVGGVGTSLFLLGLAHKYVDLSEASRFFGESAAIQRSIGQKGPLSYALHHLAQVRADQGDAAAARAMLEEALALRRELGDPALTASTLCELAALAQARGDAGGAGELFEQCLAMAGPTGYRPVIARSLRALGELAVGRGDIPGARARLRESLVVARQVGDLRDIALALDGWAGLAAAEGRWERALRLAGAVAALRESTGTAAPPAERAWLDRCLASARAVIGERAATAAWAAGRATAPEQAVAYALEEESK